MSGENNVTGTSTSADALVTPQKEERQWSAELCECFTYRTEAEKLRFSPIFMPCSCFCPCVILGRIKSKLISEPETGCCHMGHRGRCFCLGACCLLPCLPFFSLNIRQKAMVKYKIPRGCWEECKACCCACSLFQIYVSIEAWEEEKKELTKSDSARLRDKKKKEKGIVKSTELPAIPAQRNELTELVMTYMGDIMGEDEDSLVDDDDEYLNDDDFDVGGGKTRNGDKYNAVPTEYRESSHMPTKLDLIQVTIPPNHFAGSVFQIENKAGEVLEVVVPPGGKPGMKMQIPNTTVPSTLPNPPQNAKTPEPKSYMEPQGGFVRVTIPDGRHAGDVFHIQSSDGDVIEVVVPAGGKPGMKIQVPTMKVPAASSQQNRATTPPAPPISTKSEPDSKQKNAKKIKKQRSTSPKMATAPSGERKVQVTIPAGCKAGDIFELKPKSGKGENIRVRVPPGGQPGMRVLIRLPSLNSSEETMKSDSKPLRKQTPVMRESPRKDKREDKVTRHAYGSYGGGGKPVKKKPTATVTIPSGVAVGDPFMALDANTGQQVLVIVPKGAKPGMVMVADVVEDKT